MKNLLKIKQSEMDIIQDIYDKISKYKYGVPVNGSLETNMNKLTIPFMLKHYKFLSPDQLDRYKGGICYDTANAFFHHLEKNKIKCKIYWAQCYWPNKNRPLVIFHSFTVAKLKDGKYVYIEASAGNNNGIYTFKSMTPLWIKVMNGMTQAASGFKKDDKKRQFDVIDITNCIPSYGTGYQKWVNNAYDKGKMIKRGIDKEFVKQELTQESFIFQESKLTHKERTLKRLNYDPKTQTILSDIPIPGQKDGEKVRIKLSLDDEIYQKNGICVGPVIKRNPDGSIMHYPNGDYMYDITKGYEIHMGRKDLKSKGWNALSSIKHEEGHVFFKYYPDKKIDEEEKAGNFLRHENWKKQLMGNNKTQHNYHDMDEEEYAADKYSSKKTGLFSTIKMLERVIKVDYADYMKNIKALEKKVSSLENAINNRSIDEKKKLETIKNNLEELGKEMESLRIQRMQIKSKLWDDQNEIENLEDDITDDDYLSDDEKQEYEKNIEELKKECDKFTTDLLSLENQIKLKEKQYDEFNNEYDKLSIADKELAFAKIDLNTEKELANRYISGINLRIKYLKHCQKNGSLKQEVFMFPIEYLQHFQESKLSTKERDDLNDSDFGIPEKRAFPIHDEAHVKAAVKMFSHADAKDKKQLAKRILSKAKKFGMDTSGWDSINEYVQESTISGFEDQNIIDDSTNENSKNTTTDTTTSNEMMEIQNIYDEVSAKFKYGFVVNDKPMTDSNKMSLQYMLKYYHSLSIEDMDKYKVGICIDQAFYIAKLLEDKGIEHKLYFTLVANRINNVLSAHVYLFAFPKETGKCVYIETTAPKSECGVFEFKNEKMALTKPIALLVKIATNEILNSNLPEKRKDTFNWAIDVLDITDHVPPIGSGYYEYFKYCFKHGKYLKDGRAKVYFRDMSRLLKLMTFVKPIQETYDPLHEFNHYFKHVKE
jgi:hypothetical protein